jgi:hypothetical protein
MDKVLEALVVKTIAGFLNADGGTLIIGVDDNGLPTGLSRDLSTLTKRPTLDGYQQTVLGLLNNGLGTDIATRIGIEFPSVDGVQGVRHEHSSCSRSCLGQE